MKRTHNPASYRIESNQRGNFIIETRKGLPELEMSTDFFKEQWESGKITDPISMRLQRLIEFNYDFKRLADFYNSIS